MTRPAERDHFVDATKMGGPITDRQRQKIKHALGLHDHPWRNGSLARRWAYRNHYAAGVCDMLEWRALEARGMAKSWAVKAAPDLVFFSVTVAGMEAAGLLPRVPMELRR
jgi:hypothetical protein